jgi:tetratricopeptide (TPR) repeat protein
MQICRRALIPALLLAILPVLLSAADSPLDAAKAAYEKGDYTKAISVLQAEAAKDPQNGEVQLLLAKSYLETKQIDAAVSAAEKAVATAPKNSAYHQWLGQAYGEKASHASMLSAYSLARKTQKEFETAVQLDEHNFDSAQDLVEYDCTAPGMVGGGEEKAQPLIQKLMKMDSAEGHYAAGNCRQAKKDYAAAEAEFSKALDSRPKSAERIYAIGDYFVEHPNPEKLLVVASEGEMAAPKDLRAKYYRAVAWILKDEKLPDSEKLLREYLQEAPLRSTYPKPWEAHYWLGRLYEKEKNPNAARTEYEAALKLNSKYKRVQEALKQLGNK